MKTIYKQWVSSQGWLGLLWVLGLSLSLKAQPTLNPVIQWQQVIEGGIDANSQVRLARASTGNFGVLNGTALSYITPAGVLKSVGAVEGSVQINTSPVEYSKVLRTFGLTPTDDGGFVVLANDATNVYLIKKDANQNRIWSTILGSVSAYQGIGVVPASDGDFLAFTNHLAPGSLSNIAITRVRNNGTVVWNRTVLTNDPISGVGVNSRGFGRVSASPDGTYLLTGGQFSQLRRPQPNEGLALKVDGQANLIWMRSYSDIIAFGDQIPNPNEVGTFLVLGITDPNFTGTTNGPTYPYKMMADGSVARLGTFTLNSQSRIASDGSGQPYYLTVEGYGPNGGDFIVTFFNQQNQAYASKVLGGSMADVPQAVIPTGDGFLLGGTTTSTDGDVKGKQNNNLATWVVKLTKTATTLVMSQPTYNCLTGAITFNVTGGNGSPIIYTAPGITRAALTDNFGTVEQGLRNDPKPITITATQSGNSVSYTFDFKAVCSNPGGGLSLFLGSYNCQTGAIVLATTGGDGSPITYTAPGITRAALTDNFGTVEQGLRNDPKPITITARQSGKSVDFTFDFGAYCAAQPPSNPTPPTGGSLVLLAPTYNCTTGAITFNTSGGNGSTIEYQAAGITGWTTNPNQFVDKESRTANDVKPFTLMARQSGVVVTYVWDLKATCGRARTAATEPLAGLQVRVLGNPVENQTTTVEITGVAGQAVKLELLDGKGHRLHQQNIEQASALEQVSVPVSQRGGMFLLQVHTNSERQTVKLIRP